ASEHNGPVLIEFVVEQHDMVYPMVPAGADLHAMIRRPHKQFADMEIYDEHVGPAERGTQS
ncbi:MAG: hypothetical protein D6768_01230, partial [Chloroflexi bacterium]